MPTDREQPMPSKKRLTIGLLTTTMWSTTGVPLINGISDAAKEYDVNFICFQSLAPDDVKNNIIFDLIKKEKLDGMIIWASLLSNFMKPDEIEAFCARFKSLPLVSIGMTFNGIPGILADSYQGMYQAVSHLIEVHGHRRIAFIRGPESHVEANIRYQAYRNALKEHQLPFDADLVSPPGFWKEARAAREISEMLDHRKVQFDAVVGASDVLAFGVIKELKIRGFKIPRDIGVIGFNDSPECQATTPPMTSVKMKMTERGWRAVELLLQMIGGEQPPEQVIIPVKLVVRSSCGCQAPIIRAMAKSSLLRSESNPETSQTSPKGPDQTIINQIAAIFDNPVKLRPWIEKLFAAFATIIETAWDDLFLTLDDILHYVERSDIDHEELHESCSLLFDTMLPFWDRKNLAKAIDFHYQVQALIGDFTSRKERFERLRIEEANRIINTLGRQLYTEFDLEKQMNIIARELTSLGITASYLSLYVNPDQPTEKSRLLMAYNRQAGRIELEPGGRVYPTLDLLPGELMPQERYSLVVESIFFQEHEFGFIIFEYGPWDGLIYELLPVQIGAALWGAYAFQEQKRIEKELWRSNSELERFAYAASHDLQEPLRKIVAFGDRLKKVCGDSLNEQSRDYLERMQNAAARMQTLINDLLTYSRVTTKAQPFVITNLSQIGQEVLSDLEVRIAQTGSRVELGDLPEISADPVQMRQLFLNLIHNAIKFHRAGVAPLVKVYAKPVNNSEIEIVFEDNGIGIDSQHYERIFGVFEKLHGRNEYEGSGLGLAICKKIVERHGGKIRVESKVGEGASFYVSLPVKQINGIA